MEEEEKKTGQLSRAESRRGSLTVRLACSLLVALSWLSGGSHRQGPGVPTSSLAPSPVKTLSSRLPVASTCSSYTRPRDKLLARQHG